jgi:hypothetical protein
MTSDGVDTSALKVTRISTELLIYLVQKSILNDTNHVCKMVIQFSMMPCSSMTLDGINTCVIHI